MELLISLLVIVFSILVVFGNIGYFIYRKIKKKPTGECQYCKINTQKILKNYRKKYSK